MGWSYETRNAPNNIWVGLTRHVKPMGRSYETRKAPRRWEHTSEVSEEVSLGLLTLLCGESGRLCTDWVQLHTPGECVLHNKLLETAAGRGISLLLPRLELITHSGTLLASQSSGRRS